MNKATAAALEKPIREWEQKRPAVFPTAPTPERVSKAPYGFQRATVVPAAGPVKALQSHREKTALDAAAKYIGDHDMRVIESFLRDAEFATRVNITTNYERGGNAVRGPRDGSAAWSEPYREAHTRFYWILSHLDHETRQDLKDLVLCWRHQDGTLSSLSDVGQRLTGLTDKQTTKFVAVGAIKVIIRWLRYLYGVNRAMQASRPSTPEEIQRRRDERMADRVRNGLSDY
jgi:hypothetical protein